MNDWNQGVSRIALIGFLSSSSDVSQTLNKFLIKSLGLALGLFAGTFCSRILSKDICK